MMKAKMPPPGAQDAPDLPEAVVGVGDVLDDAPGGHQVEAGIVQASLGERAKLDAQGALAAVAHGVLAEIYADGI
jgi:hypothetical protein